MEIFAGFAGAGSAPRRTGAVRGVATGDMGVGKDGTPTANFQPGVELLGKYTLFAEGARGHLGKTVVAKYRLDEGRDPQTWGIGIKELWEIDPSRHRPGFVLHSAGWPLDHSTYGGGFMYHVDVIALRSGWWSGLGYTNPYLEPFQEFQRYKTHPAIRAVPRRRQADCLRRARDQRKRPAIAAEARVSRRRPGRLRRRLSQRAANQGIARGDQVRDARRGCRVRRAGGGSRARRARGVSGGVRSVLAARRAPPGAQLQAAASIGDSCPARSCSASTRSSFEARRRGRCNDAQADHEKLMPAAECTPIDYPKPDNVITFDKLSSVFLSNTEPRREPAVPPDAQRPVHSGSGQSRALRGAGSAILSGRRLRIREVR